MYTLELLGIVLCCICLHSFFCAAEMSLITCNKLRIKNLSRKGSLRAHLAETFLNNPKRFLGTILIGINLMVVISSTLMSHLLGAFLSDKLTALVSTLVMLPLVLLFAEFIPKTIAQTYPNRISMFLSPFLYFFSIVFYPFIIIVSAISEWVSKLVKTDGSDRLSLFSRDEMKLLVKEFEKKEAFSEVTNERISKIFNFTTITVSEIMIPLKKITSVSQDTPLDTIKELIQKTGLSRIPVYTVDPETIVGTLHVRRLLEDTSSTTLLPLLQRPYYIHENKYIFEVIKEMKGNGKFMAIVVDKQDRAKGIVTFEDIMEEIVGEVEDEYD